MAEDSTAVPSSTTEPATPVESFEVEFGMQPNASPPDEVLSASEETGLADNETDLGLKGNETPKDDEGIRMPEANETDLPDDTTSEEDEDGEQPEDEAEDDGEQDEGEDDGEQEEGDEDEGENEGEEEDSLHAEDGDDPFRAWLDENLTDPEDRQGLLEALASDDELLIERTANGQTEKIPLSQLKREAAGYHGQATVQRDLQTAKVEKADAERMTQEVATQAREVQATMDRFVEAVDDPAQFSNYLLEHGDQEYLDGLTQQLNQMQEAREADPVGFETRRNLLRRERVLDQRLDQIQNTLGTLMDAKGSPAGTPPGDTNYATPESGYGFRAGVGYPKESTEAVSQALELMLEGGEIGSGAVLDRWEAEKKARTPFEVAREMIGQGTVEARKRVISAAPPKRKVRTKGRAKPGASAAKPSDAPASTESEKAPDWNDIPKKLEKDIEAWQAANG